MPLAFRGGGLAGAAEGARPRRASALAAPFAGLSFACAWAEEWDERRPFLWLPVAAGAGVFLYLAADREPVLWLPLLLLALCCAAAVAAIDKQMTAPPRTRRAAVIIFRMLIASPRIVSA